MYKSIKEWWFAVGKDWNDSWKNSNLLNQTDLFLIHFANFVLIFGFLFTISQFIDAHSSIVSKMKIAGGIGFGLDVVFKFLKMQNFKVAQRFEVGQINQFDFNSSLTIYAVLSVVSLLLVLAIKIAPILAVVTNKLMPLKRNE